MSSPGVLRGHARFVPAAAARCDERRRQPVCPQRRGGGGLEHHRSDLAAWQAAAAPNLETYPAANGARGKRRLDAAQGREWFDVCPVLHSPLEASDDSNQRQATVRLVDEQGAGGKVREIFDDIKRTKGIDFVPAMWRALATNPTQLELVWTQLKTLMHPESIGRQTKLDAKTRETSPWPFRRPTAVRICVNSHTAALRKLGVDTQTLGEILAIVALFNQTNALAEGYQVEPDVLPPLE